MNKVTDNGASPLYVSSMNWYYDVVRVMVIQLTEFRLKGWNRHVLRFCRENHPGGGGSEGKKEGYIGAKRRRVRRLLGPKVC